MRYKVDHDFHIHSFLSPCSRDSQQNPQRILRYAKENGFRDICLTNHLWDSAVEGSYGTPADQTYEWLSSALPLPQEEGISFHFGCETDMDKNFVLGIGDEVFRKMEIVIISTTHLQLTGKTIEPGASLEERAVLYIKRLEKLLSLPLDFTKVCIAHPASCHASPDNPFNELYRIIDREKLTEIFTQLAKRGAGVEINSVDFNFTSKTTEHIGAIIDLYGVLKECGCRFCMGSDAHHPAALDAARGIFENAVNELGLTEDDRFVPSGFAAQTV